MAKVTHPATLQQLNGPGGNWWDAYPDAPVAPGGNKGSAGDGPWTKYGSGGANPWDSAPIVRGAGVPAGVALGPPAPEFQYKGPQAGANLTGTELENALKRHQLKTADRGAPPTGYRFTPDGKSLEPIPGGPSAPATTLIPNSNVHGADYLKTIPGSIASVVKGVASGNVMLPANALKVPYWQQVLQHTLNYDPDFNAADFNTRARTRQDYATGKMGINITALNTALGHAGEVLNDVNALNNSGGLLGTSIWNPIANKYLEMSGDPRITNFNNDTMAFGGELGKVFSGGTQGGEQERQEWRSSVPLNGSPDQQVGVLTHDAKLLRSRLDAINDQYRRGMGHTADISDLLDPHARQVYQQLLGSNPGNAPQPSGGNDSPPVGGAPGGGTPPGGTPPGWQGPSGSGDQVSLATGPSRLVDDPKASALVDSLIRRGAGADEINAAITPLGYPAVDPARVLQWQTFLKRNPNFKGQAGGGVQYKVPTTAWQRFTASPTGTGIYAGIDAALGGTADEISGTVNSIVNGVPLSQSIADANARKQLAFSTNHKAALTGNLVGGTLGYFGAGELLGGTALATGLGRAAPYVGSAAYGALSGAGQDNAHRIGGAAIGAIGGAAGQGLGELAAIPVGAAVRALNRTAPVQAMRRMFGRGISTPSPLSAGQDAALRAINVAGPDSIRGALTEAQSLGVPMSLADTSPQLSTLAGAAVRRSPNAAAYAEGQLIPRNRGQINRFGAAVKRDLGPVANIPQTSADLTAQARAAAAPLYDQAYAAPGASSVNLDDLMTRPSMKAGLQRAYGIAAEEGRDPTSLGFDLNDQGEVVLNRVPSFQTLDYVKRGLDDTLEPHRNPITGKLALNEATGAINRTKNTLLSRMDAVNPAYAQARATYAGPVHARDALARGQDAFSLSSDELAMQVAGQSPEHLAQMQAGFRSEMMNRANAVRDVSNPFEATLGSPEARAQVDAIYPGNPGNARLFRQRDLEQGLQRTTTDILGNSKTAQRQIADQAFEGSPLPSLAIDATLMAHGGVPIASIARGVARGKLGDALQLGLGKRAIRKADELAPLLLNIDPAAASQTLEDLIRQGADLQAYRLASRPVKPLGMFGSGLGTSLATRPY
jgi:hypothetical protein